MARHNNIDALDAKLLAILQHNGRMTNVKLAEAVGISAPPCLRRLKALEDQGWIESYQANVSATKLGYGLTAFANVGLSTQAEADLIAFEAQTKSWPEVRECYRLSGEIDYLLKIVTEDLERFQTFVNERLTSAENVSTVKTSLCIKTAVAKPGVPMEWALKQDQSADASGPPI